jgi:hypothetical protein
VTAAGTKEIAPVVVPLQVLAAIAHLTFVYRFWSSIRDGSPRMSPGKAIGLLLVPFFNIYWLFQVYGGFATDSNKYAKEKGINAPNLSRGLLVFSAALILIPIPLLNWIVQTMAISKICNMVNAVHAK